METLKNKTAVVLGGASGIGLAIAERLAKEGAQVFLSGRRSSDVDVAVAKVGQKAVGLVGNPGDPEQIESMVAKVQSSAQNIDAFVFNAGLMEAAELADSTPEHFAQHFDLNVRGPLLALRTAAVSMKSGSSALVVGSVADVRGATPYATYAATKAALRSYVRSWAMELAPRGVRVNVVSPGPTETGMMASVPDDMRAGIVSQIPLGRMGCAEEVASAALFLLSDEASFITGAELYVDGGMAQV